MHVRTGRSPCITSKEPTSPNGIFTSPGQASLPGQVQMLAITKWQLKSWRLPTRGMSGRSNRICIMLQTEFEFTLPHGYIDAQGNLHRRGIMRLATALDEIEPLQDTRVRANQA